MDTALEEQVARVANFLFDKLQLVYSFFKFFSFFTVKDYSGMYTLSVYLQGARFRVNQEELPGSLKR